MAGLPNEQLTRHLLAALPSDATPERSETEPKPLVVDLPELGRVRIYLWTTTADASAVGRPEDEHKSQLILPGQQKGDRGRLDVGDIPTFILGYSPLYGVYAAWDAERHREFSHSTNIQVKGHILRDAVETGWAVGEPKRTNEVVVAIRPSHLLRFFKFSIEADRLKLDGEARQAFLLAAAPEIAQLQLPAKIAAGEAVSLQDVQRERTAAGTRLKRDPKFKKEVLKGFDGCAVCGVQLNIIEAAHIIPIDDSKGTDDTWNGLALCRNHHRLFDRRIILIDSSAIVRANEETLKELDRVKQLGGYETLIGAFRDRRLRSLPTNYAKEEPFTSLMNQALNYIFVQFS